MKRAITAICVTGSVSMIYAGVAVTHTIDERQTVLTPQVNTLVITVLAVAFMVTIIWAAVLRIEAGQRGIVEQIEKNHRAAVARIETEQRAAQARSDRRYHALKSALVSIGALVEDNTGELRRASGAVSAAYPAIDPGTVRLLNQIDRELGEGRPGQ